MAVGGGYIPEPSHFVKYSEERMKAMHDMIRDYGHEFYAKKSV